MAILRTGALHSALLMVAISCVLSLANDARSQVLGESILERRAREEAEAKRKHQDDALKHAQRWNKTKAQEKAAKLLEERRLEREERLQEIAFIYGDLLTELPQETSLVNRPYPSEFTVSGSAKPRYDLDSDIAGGIALQLNLKKVRNSKRDRFVLANTIAPIKRGDVLCLTFWARAGGKKGQTAMVEIPELGVRAAAEPWGAIARRSVSLNEQWQHFSFSFSAPENFESGRAQVYFKLGTQKQKIEFGPAYLFDLGPVDISSVSGRACKA